MPQVPPDLAGNPDRLRWNERYGSGPPPTFRAHEVARLALSASAPDGPVLELAGGPSGSALLAAERGRRVTVVDVSEVALDLLVAEARRRDLEELISVVQADLTTWQPPPRQYAAVLCTGYWDRGVFAIAAGLVAPGGCIGWEALTQAARLADPPVPAEWCVATGEPASLLPADFAVISQQDVGRKRVLLARRHS